MNKLLLIFTVATLVLFSCRKQPASTTTTDNIIKKDSIIPMDAVCIQNLVYTSFSSKAKVDYNDGQTNVTANLNIKIKKDSLIWLSGTMFGFEGIRAMISKDSIWYINKLEKTYSAYSLQDLGKKMNIDLTFEIIEALLVGNAPLIQRNQDLVRRDTLLVHLTQNEKDLTIINQINVANCKLEKLEVKQNMGYGNAEINFANFNSLENMLFAFNNAIHISYTDQTGIHKTQMVINHNKVDLNLLNLKFPFNIPNRYERK
jgi:hypothetical protein